MSSDLGSATPPTVRLPADRRLEGFGSQSVYLSRVDGLEFVWLERYELPAL